MLDDYSRYILAGELCPGMQAVDVERTVQAALQASNLRAGQRPRILSDNGSAYVSRHLKEYLKGESMEHVRCAPFHPMTQGKIERYHRSMKNVLLLEHYYSPDELISRLTEWVHYYNHQRYHESLENVRPADAYWGRQDQILVERQKIKRLSMLKRRKSGPPLWSYFSASPKCLKPSLLFSPVSVHFWLTTYNYAFNICSNKKYLSCLGFQLSFIKNKDTIFSPELKGWGFEDREFVLRQMRKQTHEIVYAPDLQVWHLDSHERSLILLGTPRLIPKPSRNF